MPALVQKENLKTAAKSTLYRRSNPEAYARERVIAALKREAINCSVSADLLEEYNSLKTREEKIAFAESFTEFQVYLKKAKERHVNIKF